MPSLCRGALLRAKALGFSLAVIQVITHQLTAAEPGNVTYISQTASSVVLAGNGNDQVIIRVLRPNLIQCDYRPNNQASPHTLIMDPGFPSKSWTPGSVTIINSANEVTITTTALIAKISKNPCRVNIFNPDGTTRIVGESASGGMSDSRIRIEYDAGLNWYGLQSAPSKRGRDIDGSSTANYISKSFVTNLTRNNTNPVADLNTRYHGSQTGPFAWTTGAANKPGFGVLWDNDGGSVSFSGTTLEMNKTGERATSAVSSSKLNTLWFIMVGTPDDITTSFMELSGKPQMFPKYAHGFGNTEWGINDVELRSHINGYRSRNIPLEQFTLDFDWKSWDLNPFGNFEWNTNETTVSSPAYPGFPSASTTTLKDYADHHGVKLMGITKPRLHVNTPQGSEISAGNQANALWKNSTSVGWWLPSNDPNTFSFDYWGSMRGRSDRVGNLNFFIPAARAWYGRNTIDRAFDKGIVGYWNDEGDEGHDANDIPAASNFYNNLYQESIYSYQRSNRPGTRVWSMNRHSYLGAQRYGYGVWSGDITTDWRILKTEAPRMLQTINAGMARTGTDAGGTSGEDDGIGGSGTGIVNSSIPMPELYTRWVQFAAFQPTFRIHGVWKIQRQPWFYGSTAEAAVTEVIRLRARLMPYIYAHDHLYAETGLPFVRALMWDYPKDTNVANRTDAWMFGRYLLASPILDPRVSTTSSDGSASLPGTTTKSIYLPSGTWFDYFRGTVHNGGTTLHYAVDSTAWNDIPLFIKKGAIIPSLMTAPNHVNQQPISQVTIDVFPDTTPSSFPYYDDDGVSYQYESGTYFKQNISQQLSGSQVTISLGNKEGSYTPALQSYLIALNAFNASGVNGFTQFSSLSALQAAAGEGWARGENVHGTVTYIKTAVGAARSITANGNVPGLGIVTTQLPTATRQAPYEAQVVADGLGSTSTWTVSPALPSGLVLDQHTGRITGTPLATSSGTYTFQISSGGTTTKQLSLAVIAAPFAAYEPFPFTSGAIDWNGLGGENGFSEPWQRLVDGNGQSSDPVFPCVYIPGLTAGTHPTSGGGVQFGSMQQIPGNSNSQKNPEFSRRLLSGFRDSGTPGENAWIGFIGQGISPGSGFLGVGLFNSSTEKLLIGQRFGISQWGVEVAGGGGSGTSSVSLSNSAFVVVNIRVLNESSRAIRMWLNPTQGVTPPSDANAVVSFTTGSNLSFDTVRLRGDSMVSALKVDELHLADSFSAVCGLATTAPELTVLRNGSLIPHTSADVISGSFAATALPLSYQFTNDGTALLSLTTLVTITGTSNCTVTTTQPNASIAAGSSSTGVVTITPTAVGNWACTVQVGTNDSDENPATWSISGTAASVAQPQVQAVHPFYNNSAWDGNNALPNVNDDAAVAAEKSALLPGQTATFLHYTSYSRGLNGIIMDVINFPGTPLISDFQCAVGNTATPGLWPMGPAPTSVTLRPAAGELGSDRLTIIWPDNAIKNQWLKVTVPANTRTGLAAAYVFYLGNAVGESGNSSTDTLVNASDQLAARNNPRGPANLAPLSFVVDFNRDRLVNAADQLLSRTNATSPVTALKLITAP